MLSFFYPGERPNVSKPFKLIADGRDLPSSFFQVFLKVWKGACEVQAIFKFNPTYAHPSRIPAEIFLSDIKYPWREPVTHFSYKDQFLKACTVTSNVFGVNGDLTTRFKIFAEINLLLRVNQICLFSFMLLECNCF